MAGINAIQMEDIERLSALHLSQILLKLLQLEAKANALPAPNISVPFNITTGDGGEDGHIKWEGGPALTPRLPNRYTFFQNKATDLYPGECGEELLVPQSKEDEKKGIPRVLKAQVRQMVEAGGTYVLFTTRPIVETGKRQRTAGFRSGLASTEHENPDSVQFLVYDANDIAAWVNEHMAAVTMVQGFAGISRPAGFITWQEWSQQPAVRETTYHADATLQGYTELIADFSEPVKKLRICGHSGLGKSRLVFEAFRNSPHQSSIVYYNLNGDKDIHLLKTYMISHREHHLGTIVVDNCPAESHVILSELVYGEGKLGIITIGFDSTDGTEDPMIKLDRENQFAIVGQIIVDKLPTHDPQDIEYLQRLCEGYPWMANRFCNDILRTGMKGFSTLLPRDFIKKLLFDTDDHPGAYEAVRACSVFSSFGFPDEEFRPVVSSKQLAELKEQLEYIRINLLNEGVTYDQFYEICQKYRRDDIIERRGLFYVVKPTVLAMNLATDWLINTDPEKVKAVLIDLKGKDLMSKMAERLKDLDQISKAAAIVAELCAPSGFFGSAEVLTSSWGSLLFRYLVEVNPKATVDALYTAIGTWTIDQLKTIRESRRNLVWALEKLCFRPESFSKAARLLFLLAAAENERWSNNATNQFFQLFHLFLSGTQASYDERLLILRWGLAKQDETFSRLVIQAIGKAWKFRHAYRMGGAEKQGSSPPLKDYRPTSGTEVVEYIRRTMELLRPFALFNDELGSLARLQVTAATRELISGGSATAELVTTLISDIHRALGGAWKEAYDELAKSLQYEVPAEPIEGRIRQLMEDLTPKDLKTTIQFSVIKPRWQPFEQTREGRYVDKAKLDAESFAGRVISEKIDLEPFLVDLLSGEQMQTFAFAQKLGADRQQLDRLLPAALAKLRAIPADIQNPSFVAGLINGANDDAVFDRTIGDLLSDPSIARVAFFVTQNYKITLASLTRLFELVDANVVTVTAFSVFQYGSILDALTNEEMITLCTKMRSYGSDGEWTALCLYFMDAFKDAERWAALQGSIKELISSNNFLLTRPSPRVMEAYYWSSSVINLLDSHDDVSFATHMSDQIIAYCAVPELNYNYDLEVLKVVQSLFNRHFDAVWERFGACLLGPFPGYYNMLTLLQTRDVRNVKASWMFEDTTRWDKFFDWVDQHKETGARRIAALMPLGERKNDTIVWHAFARSFIDRFGEQPGVLEAISASMGTFMVTGSATDHYVTQRQLLLALQDSPSLEVRDWVAGMLTYMDREVKRSQIDDEGGPMSQRVM